MLTEKRLIDANALLRKKYEIYEMGDPEELFSQDFIHNVVSVKDVKNAPTVDAVEVVHGRWLPDMEEFDDDPSVGIRGGVFQTGWKCSICGRSEQVKEPYCNCGAKMDGERKDNEN